MEIIAAQIRSDQCFERKKRNVPLLTFFIYPRNYLETATSPGLVTFCHNDLQQGMIHDKH